MFFSIFDTHVPLGYRDSLVAWKFYKLTSNVNSFVAKIYQTPRESELLLLARNKRNKKKFSNLISVAIPTHNRSNLLSSRSVPSVLKQTYQKFEIIVVGDNCTDDTKDKLDAFNDCRIKFTNLSESEKLFEHAHYPKDPFLKWMVAGYAAANKCLDLCSGDWIAPMDDDDEFTKDHLEVLLKYALDNDYEMVYGVVQMETSTGKWSTRGSHPLRVGHICRLSALYRADLNFFKADSNAWKYAEPGDWNIWRRMKAAGVRIGFINKVVGIHYLERKHLRHTKELSP